MKLDHAYLHKHALCEIDQYNLQGDPKCILKLKNPQSLCFCIIFSKCQCPLKTSALPKVDLALAQCVILYFSQKSRMLNYPLQTLNTEQASLSSAH